MMTYLALYPFGFKAEQSERYRGYYSKRQTSMLVLFGLLLSSDWCGGADGWQRRPRPNLQCPKKSIWMCINKTRFHLFTTFHNIY